MRNCLAQLHIGVYLLAWGWLKDLAEEGEYNIANAGSDEAKQLLEVKRAFERAWNNGKGQKNTTNDGGVQFMLEKDFANKVDAWLKDTKPSDRITDGGYFRVGTTSDPLKDIGVRDGDIYWRKQKIGYIMADHPEMDATTIKGVPGILENPIVVMKSLTRDDSIVLFGELTASDNRRVMASLELTPKAGGGMEADFSLLTSSYARDGQNIQNLLKNSEILYLDANKNRTDTWLMPLGVQFPSGQLKYDSIGRITYDNGNVNIIGEKLFENATFSKPQFSLSDTDIAPIGNFNVYGKDVMAASVSLISDPSNDACRAVIGAADDNLIFEKSLRMKKEVFVFAAL